VFVNGRARGACLDEGDFILDGALERITGKVEVVFR
jgi:hypothetical protein